MDINTLIKQTSLSTPDPERSFKNLERLLWVAPDFLENYRDRIKDIAKLFSYSQFLADYCVRNTINLGLALENYLKPIDREKIQGMFLVCHNSRGVVTNKEHPLRALPSTFRADIMKSLREIKKRYLLRITLRDILGVTNLDECMAELSILGDAIVEIALSASYALMKARFGELKDNPFVIVALGKLGAGELNYSSDIDIITVYGSEEGRSTGMPTPSGVKINRITAHEYFCRLTETLSGLLMSQTEDGIAYRVDLRLRPDGRKGELSLSLNSYVTYYESWGKTWERMALIRARPIAGDTHLGEMFMRSVEPFVWKKSADYYDIEEIRELKRKIDTIFDANDIKRGYGGIREIEFFVQTFQLLYGGEKRNLRAEKLAKVLKELLKEGFLNEEDIGVLGDNYTFLRRLEHILQMKDDLQTHSLPSQLCDLEVLARKMRFGDLDEFMSELKLKRLIVRDMYNSLLGSPESQQETMVFLEEDLPDNKTRDYLAFKGFKDPDLALQNIRTLNEKISLGKTIRERTLLRKTVPFFLDRIFKSENKDRVLGAYVTFIEKYGSHESYSDLFVKEPAAIELVVNTLSKSTYLTRLMLGIGNLDSLFEYPAIHMDYKAVRGRLLGMLKSGSEPMNTIREFKAIEEMALGLLFIQRILDMSKFSTSLSMLADTILRTVLEILNVDRDFAIVGLGKLGSGELNIGSDLDLIFIVGQETVSGVEASNRLAEEIIKFVSEYTARGVTYEVDMRLRPDGTKGVLVNDIAGYENYYLKHAHPWEIQALLRARPIAGNKERLKEFHNLKRRIIAIRGKEVAASDIKNMRSRIINEVSRESAGYDIKLGPGGIEEIEFLVQYLQLKHSADYPELITHKTTSAIKRLYNRGILDSNTEERLSSALAFMRTVETLLRLNEEPVLKADSDLANTIARFFDFESKDALTSRIEIVRREVLGIVSRCLS